MRIGIYIDYLKAGGVTTSSYEQSILNAIDRSDSDNEFYIFTNSRKSDFYSNFNYKKIQCVSIREYDFFIRNRHILRFLLTLSKIFFKIIRLQSLKRRVEYILTVSALNKALHSYNIRLFWQPFGIETVDIPYVQTCYDCNDRVHPYLPEFTPDAEVWKDYNQLRMNLFQRASYIIVGTEQLKREVMLYYGIAEERIRKIPLFVPEISKVKTYITSSSFDYQSLPSQYLFFPARLIPQKNHIVILLALKILKLKYNMEVSVVFTGLDKGNKNYIFQKIKELELENNVKYFGVVSFEDLTYLYSNAFALVFPPFNGPDNLPPLEAFSLGCPVIASKLSGALEQMGDSALLFDPLDEHALAECIMALYKDENLRMSLIEKGYRRIKGNTADRYISEFIKITEEFDKIARAWNGSDYHVLPNLPSI